MSTWISQVRGLADLVYPRNCQTCAAGLAAGETGVLCPACLASVRFIQPPCCERCGLPFAGQPSETFTCGYCQDQQFNFARAVCAARAEGVVRAAVHDLKYRGRMYFLEHLADWLGRAAGQYIDWREVDAIVPVPLHPRKQRERGFNQAALLAGSLARPFAVPVLGLVFRVEPAVVGKPAQHGQDNRAAHPVLLGGLRRRQFLRSLRLIGRSGFLRRRRWRFGW